MIENKDDLRKFKKLYNKAVSKEEVIFLFKGDEILTGYAKYVIEYETNRYKK